MFKFLLFFLLLVSFFFCRGVPPKNMNVKTNNDCQNCLNDCEKESQNGISYCDEICHVQCSDVISCEDICKGCIEGCENAFGTNCEEECRGCYEVCEMAKDLGS
eukprot:TRINITY_DN2887_c0_g1_i1.p2 TRINITY_DN2887_c0_g1~~TRINITY_DN2887_c0_g1_i1.p2  ORF type:complete len:104 (-),score=18.26 TRINITY_DN2887_c0_g1_i1:263-574(-)